MIPNGKGREVNTRGCKRSKFEGREINIRQGEAKSKGQ